MPSAHNTTAILCASSLQSSFTLTHSNTAGERYVCALINSLSHRFHPCKLTNSQDRRVASCNHLPRCRQVSSFIQIQGMTSTDEFLGAPLAIVSLVLIAGALLLMLLVVIGGAVDKNPTNQFYFLQADTSAIPGAPGTSRWTFWNTCGDTNGRNACPHVHPAYAFDPKKNFGTTTGVPASLVQQ